MAVNNVHLDLLPQVVAALSGLAALSLRALSAGEQQRNEVAIDLLERILRVSDATRGGIVELLETGASDAAQTEIRPVVLSRIFTRDVESLLTAPRAQDDGKQVIHKGGDWLRFELPMPSATPPNATSAIESQPSRMMLLLGWPPRTPPLRLQEAQTVVLAIAEAAAAVVAALGRSARREDVDRTGGASAAADTTWEQIFDAVSDPMCVVTADYRLERANAAYIKLFGLNRYGVPGHECYAQFPGQTMPCVNCPLPHTIRTGEVAFVQQERLIPVAGGAFERRLYQRWAYPIFRPDGVVDRIVEILKDVTEQEHTRQSQSQAEALREADQFKSELLGTVSHELRSPLTAIKGYAATLLRHERRLAREERYEFLTAIVEASDALQVIIDRLLEMSQIETGALHIEQIEVNLYELAQAALNDITQANAGSTHQFEFALSVDQPDAEGTLPHWDVKGDPLLLRDMLDNLLENAVKYSPAGGHIEISLRSRIGSALTSTDGTVLTESAPDSSVRPMGRTIEIVVSDTGMGIPEEHLERIFERFHRVDMRLTREVGGLGLGLAICQRIAERHGGIIWAESTPGKGSSFHIQLPALEDTSNLSEQ